MVCARSSPCRGSGGMLPPGKCSNFRPEIISGAILGKITRVGDLLPNLATVLEAVNKFSARRIKGLAPLCSVILDTGN